MLDEKLLSEVVSRVVKQYGDAATYSSVNNVPVGVSNRHIHLTQEHLEILFGKGYSLTPIKDLSQPGQYACKELLTIVGPSMRPIENVRVLGPLRSRTQVEISRTDSYILKNKPPVRPSGDIIGSAPVTIIGPKGTLSIAEGCIIANRHIHMSPGDAEAFRVKDGDLVAVEADGERKTVFYDVQIRVSNEFRLELHLDTDDANAACLVQNAVCRILN